MSGWRLEQGDALALMRQLPAGSVDAIVTSPPYADQRTYQSGGWPANHNASRKQRREAPNKAVEFLSPHLTEMLRIVSPQGSAMVNLGVIIRAGEESTWIDHVAARAREQGWRLLQRMVWFKTNSIAPSHRLYLRQAHEYVLWLAPSIDAFRGYHGGYPDEDPDLYPGYDPATRKPHTARSIRRIGQPYIGNGDERYRRRGQRHRLHPDGAKPASVVAGPAELVRLDDPDQDHPHGERPQTLIECGVGGGEQHGTDHTAVMALDVAIDLVRLCCPTGGLVLDPFAGVATSGVAALRTGRRFLGFELRQRYVDQGRRRLDREAGLLAGEATSTEDLGPPALEQTELAL